MAGYIIQASEDLASRLMEIANLRKQTVAETLQHLVKLVIVLTEYEIKGSKLVLVSPDGKEEIIPLVNSIPDAGNSTGAQKGAS